MSVPNINVNVSGPQRNIEVNPKTIIQLTEDVNNLLASVDRITDSLPTLGADDAGYSTFSSTLRKPVWWSGTSWVDALGNSIDTEYQIVIEGEDGNE